MRRHLAIRLGGMAVTSSQLEEIVTWCGASRQLQVEGERARRLSSPRAICARLATGKAPAPTTLACGASWGSRIQLQVAWGRLAGDPSGQGALSIQQPGRDAAGGQWRALRVSAMQSLPTWCRLAVAGSGCPGQGWLQWPSGIGPTMQQNLKQWQIDPIGIERVLKCARNQGTSDELRRTTAGRGGRAHDRCQGELVCCSWSGQSQSGTRPKPQSSLTRS